MRKVNLTDGDVSVLPYLTTATETGAYGVTIAANGQALLTDSGIVSPEGVIPLRQLSTADDSITFRSDGPGAAGVGPASVVARSLDGGTAVLLEPSITGQPLYVYSAASDTFSASTNTSTTTSSSPAAALSSGSLIAVREGTTVTVYDRNLNVVKTLTGFQSNLVFDPARPELYGFDTAGHLLAYNTSTWHHRGPVRLGDPQVLW